MPSAALPAPKDRTLRGIERRDDKRPSSEGPSSPPAADAWKPPASGVDPLMRRRADERLSSDGDIGMRRTTRASSGTGETAEEISTEELSMTAMTAHATPKAQTLARGAATLALLFYILFYFRKIDVILSWIPPFVTAEACGGGKGLEAVRPTRPHPGASVRSLGGASRRLSGAHVRHPGKVPKWAHRQRAGPRKCRI